MKKSIIKSALISVFALLLVFTGCSKAPSTPESASDSASVPAGETVVLKVGVSPSPHAEILESIVPILAEQGIDLQIEIFTDYVIPNLSLESGELDANYFQHQPYLDSYNEEKGTNLVGAAKIHSEAFGIYSAKHENLDSIDGATIAIPNDVTNEARALQLLEAQGLIKLKEGVGLEATPKDIVENPNNLKFKELAAEQLPILLNDAAIDFAVINGNYALGAGLAGTAIVLEDVESVGADTYANVVAVRAGDEKRPEILALIAALTSEETRTFLEETYQGVVAPTF